MATTTVTHPVEFPQPKQIARQGLTIIALLVVGLVLGMLIDTGRRTGSVEAAQLTQSQQAAADRLSAQAAQLTQSPQAASDLAIARAAAIAAGPLTQAQQAVADRLGAQAAAFRAQAVQDLADSIAAVSATLPELTQEQLLIDLANRGVIPAEAAVVAPSVIPEHGPFTAMQYRDPSVSHERFAGRDANLDPDAVVGVVTTGPGGISLLGPAQMRNWTGDPELALVGPTEWMRYGIPSIATGPGSMDDVFAPGDVISEPKTVELGRGSYGYRSEFPEVLPGLPY